VIVLVFVIKPKNRSIIVG